MTIAWPAEVPQAAQVSGYSEEPQRNVASFPTDVGPPIARRRSSVATTRLGYTSMPLTAAEAAALMMFYTTTLKDGVLPFTRMHPRTEDSITAQFVAAPTLTPVSGDIWTAKIELMVLP